MTGERPAGSGVSPFVHQAAIYGSEEGFLAAVVPFLRRGAAAGEPTLVGFDQHDGRLVRDALGDTTGITFLPADGYADPLTTLKANRELLGQYARSGPVRLAGRIPTDELRTNWYGWIRYEAAIGQVLAALPVRALCAYDSRCTPDAVLADVERSHPHLIDGDGRAHSNARFLDPATLLVDRMRGTPDPLERTAPALELADPPISIARNAVTTLAGRTRLSAHDVDGLVLAVNEIVTNAYKHGGPAVTLRAWANPERLIVTITDTGSGPAHPLAGLAPAADVTASGCGLWIAHQMCHRVDHVRHTDGFTVRLIAKAP